MDYTNYFSLPNFIEYPEPPNKVLIEIYKQKEDEIKKANYQRKYVSNYSS